MTQTPNPSEQPQHDTDTGQDTLTNLESDTEKQRNQAIALFNEQRDIPYRIIVDPNELDMRKFPDCIGKSIRLHEALEK